MENTRIDPDLIQSLLAQSVADNLLDADLSPASFGLSQDDVANFRAGQVGSLATLDACARMLNLKLTSSPQQPRDIGVSFGNSQPVRVIFYNFAGGVGKTTLVRDIGQMLVHLGFRVLVVDLDAQASLTYSAGVFPILKPEGMAERSLTRFLLDENAGTPFPKPLSLPSSYDIIPGSEKLALVKDISIPKKRLFRSMIYELSRQYDFVLFDPTNIRNDLCNLGAACSHFLVAPVSLEGKGVENLHATFELVLGSGQELKIAFVVPTKAAKTKACQKILNTAHRDFGEQFLFSSPLYTYDLYQEARFAEQPVPLFAPKHKAVAEIRQVALRLLDVVGTSVMSGEAANPRQEMKSHQSGGVL
jgi:chromosome partitioning protein